MDRARVHAYMELFEVLRRRLRWKAGTDVLRIAALSLAAAPHDDPVERLTEAVNRLRKAAPWTSPLRSSIVYAIAAMLLRRDLEPEAVVRGVEQVRKGFRARKFRRGGNHEVLAALILVLLSDGREISGQALNRVGAILKRWKADHPLITGYDDYPMAALHALSETPVDQLGRDVELIYRELHRLGYARGNRLQLASHLLAMAPLHPRDAAMRFRQMVEALERVGIKVAASRYDETALLVLSGEDPGSAAREAVTIQDELRATRAKPARSMAFSLAVGLLLWDVSERKGTGGRGRDAAAVRAVQALLEIQQAAAMAAIAASTAAGAS